MDNYECVVCGDDLPEGRRLTCCPDCYRLWRFYKLDEKRGMPEERYPKLRKAAKPTDLTSQRMLVGKYDYERKKARAELETLMKELTGK